MTDVLLSAESLSVWYGERPAVEDVSLELHAGEVLAVVGESGSGKTTLALGLAGLLGHARLAGTIRWRGDDVDGVPGGHRRLLGREIGVVFQEPRGSLNPVHRVGAQVAEVLRVHRRASRAEARAAAVELLAAVGIPEPARRARQYPHELSGGMCQRVAIAMALAAEPDVLIADEPTSALDVTVQAQVLELLAEVVADRGTAVLLVTHDLGVVAGVADRVLVLYAGKEVERGPTAEVFDRTRHPYTAGLLASLPRLDADELHPIGGAPPSLLDRPPGCPFHPRCSLARVPGVCRDVDPPLRVVGGPGHRSACHFAEELAGERSPT